jgi:6-phosphogluconate dehydrogenase
MSNPIDTFGIVGLGRMGADLAFNAAGKGFTVAGFDPHADAAAMKKAGVRLAPDLPSLIKLLPQPRLVMLYIPAGAAVDETLAQLTKLLDPGDIVADGGNSYWGDSIRRHELARKSGLHFIDVGTSGGPSGARDGACFMVGGDDDIIAKVEPLLRKLAVEGGYVHAGPVGSGHFTKLVHNGIEFGMLQAIGEGLDLLTHYRERLPVADILKCWEHGSVIRSWLVELMEKAYREQKLDAVSPYVDDTGEVNWLVDDALNMEVAIPVITQSVLQLVASRDRGHNAARAVSMMRHGFGGHAFGPSKGAAYVRHQGRVGVFFRSNGVAR